MRLSWRWMLALALTVALAAPGCSGGNPKGDRDRAIATAIAAVHARDAKRYATVMVSFEDFKIYCPPKVSANSGKTALDFTPGALDGEAKILRKLRGCADVDWTKAKEISRRGGELRRPLTKKCGTSLSKYRDIRVSYALENGDRAELRLDDPVGVQGEYFAFLDEPRCRIRPAPADEVGARVDAFGKAACACVDMACVTAVDAELQAYIKAALASGAIPSIGMELRAKIADAATRCAGKFTE